MDAFPLVLFFHFYMCTSTVLSFINTYIISFLLLLLFLFFFISYLYYFVFLSKCAFITKQMYYNESHKYFCVNCLTFFLYIRLVCLNSNTNLSRFHHLNTLPEICQSISNSNMLLKCFAYLIKEYALLFLFNVNGN